MAVQLIPMVTVAMFTKITLAGAEDTMMTTSSPVRCAAYVVVAPLDLNPAQDLPQDPDLPQDLDLHQDQRSSAA